jgi:hypothetical protein
VVRQHIAADSVSAPQSYWNAACRRLAGPGEDGAPRRRPQPGIGAASGGAVLILKSRIRQSKAHEG